RVRRFEEFQARTGAPRPVLADRLRMLVEEGVFERRQYSERPPRHAARPRRYKSRLADRGLALYPVLISLLRWGDRWMADEGDPPPVELRHRACGATMTPELACPSCRELLTARDIEA